MWGFANKTYLAIHGCEIDLAASRIKGLKGWIQLKPKSMEVLKYLLGHPLKVCTREEILNAVWGRSIVSDDVLSQAISELRKAFNDDFHSPAVLETIPRSGYRLLLEPITRKTSYRVWYWPVIFAMAAIAIFLVYLYTTRPQELARQTIVVLPFVNMSDDAANEYFSDGISEELLNLLAKIPELRVISRSSAFYFKGKDVKFGDLARELNATYIIEGSVRKAGNQVRITAQLIEARTDTHLWSETYDRELENIFDIQDEISESIVGALKRSLNIQLETAPKTITTTNIEAHDAYLRGRYLVVQRTTTSIEAAAREFEKAITLDPDYALAHAELAIAYLLLSSYGGDLTANEAIAISMPHIDRAMVLDSNLAEAYAATGLLLMSRENWEDGLTYFNQAIRINPNYSIAHTWKGMALAHIGRYEEAYLTYEATLRLNPLSIVAIRVYTQSLQDRNLLDKAGQELEKIASIYPAKYAQLRGELTSLGGKWANLALGALDSIRIKRSRVVYYDLSEDFAFIGLEQEALSISETAFVLRVLGRPGEAVRAMEEHLGENPAPDDRFFFGRLLGSAGDYDRARPILEEAWQWHGGQVTQNGFELPDAAALIAIRRDAGDETGVDEILAAIKDNVRRYRETGYTNGPWYVSADFEEGVAAYLAGEREQGLMLIAKAADGGFFIFPNQAYLQTLYDDPGFAPIIARQGARQARERKHFLSIVCTDNPYVEVWQPADGTCERFAAESGN
jgi:TolB-like protein/DNA-binding winged helix-turn-helix (wHTH) protein/Tfp pilus assembly protein PilF